MQRPTYGLMDTETANMVGVYPSREAALADVREAIRRYGRDSAGVLSLALAREDLPPEKGFIASGRELVELALHSAEARGA